MSLVSDATTKLTYSCHGDQSFLILVGVGKNGPVSPPAEWPIKMIPIGRKVTDHPRRFGEVLLPPVKALIGDPGCLRQMNGANITTSGLPWKSLSSVTGSAQLRSVTPRPSNMFGKTLKYEQSA